MALFHIDGRRRLKGPIHMHGGRKHNSEWTGRVLQPETSVLLEQQAPTTPTSSPLSSHGEDSDADRLIGLTITKASQKNK
jgi:hypothetical protein